MLIKSVTWSPSLLGDSPHSPPYSPPPLPGQQSTLEAPPLFDLTSSSEPSPLPEKILGPKPPLNLTGDRYWYKRGPDEIPVDDGSALRLRKYFELNSKRDFGQVMDLIALRQEISWEPQFRGLIEVVA